MKDDGLLPFIGILTIVFLGYQFFKPRLPGGDFTVEEAQRLMKLCDFPINGDKKWFVEGAEPIQLKPQVRSALAASMDQQIPTRSSWTPAELVDATVQYLSPGCQFSRLRAMIASIKTQTIYPDLLRLDAEIDVLDALATERLEAAGLRLQQGVR